ncbi:F-box/kelch-repeat protein SKIP20 [Mercurialis annua]|uniref:F-box/kelch-repeat protein SKIP20 n=1 Tax=Mercurialis annua TaxID=3986 RepID=UPI00215E44DA|nr:F-box/kelch-repeat protein SKIP20 [Mercurialis annua]
MEMVLKSNQELIPGLPDEIGRECLVKVPFEFHGNMKSVCHSWKNLISHPSFYQQRFKLGTSEHLVCLVQPLPQSESADPVTGEMVSATVSENEDKTVEQQQQQQRQQIHTPPQFALSIFNINYNLWRRTRPHGGIPMFCQCLSVPSQGKILLIGGWDSATLEPVPDVHILDLTAGGKWRRGASMSVSRSFFACALVGSNLVYVAGGHDGQKNALKSAEVYDIEKDEWRTVADMNEERDECEGLSWDGESKFWVVSGYGSESQGQFRSDGECYDPVSGRWSKVDGVWPFNSVSPRGVSTAVSGGGNEKQWWWFLRDEQDRRQQGRRRGEDMSVEIVDSIQLPDCLIGNSPFVSSLGYGKVFVMGGKNVRTSVSCNECECEGAFILDKDWKNGSVKWNHVHTPVQFSGFPFSACHLTM